MINIVDSIIGFFIVWFPLWALFTMFNFCLLIYIIILLKKQSKQWEKDRK